MTGAAGVVRPQAMTDPRTALIALALALLAAVALRGPVAVALAMGGIAGFSLSGSP